MTPEMHTPCPVCGAMALTGSHRCRYCGEVLVDDLELAETEVERASAGVGTDNIALLVAIGSTALPVHAAISGFTPPYDIPIEAVALGPHVLVAVVLGFFVGLFWLSETSRFVAPWLAFLFNGIAFVQMTSWRALVIPVDLDLLPIGCMVGLVAAVGAWLGRAVAWFTRRSPDSSDEAIATLAG